MMRLARRRVQTMFKHHNEVSTIVFFFLDVEINATGFENRAAEIGKRKNTMH
jgi:hypothetical protein